jgi:hypothetical protein
MIIRMLSLAAGPQGVWRPGMEIEVSEEEALALIKGHFAVPVGGSDGRYTSLIGGNVAETAMLAPAQPILVPTAELRLTFGRYKGKTVREIYAENPKYVTDFLAHNEDPDIAVAAKAAGA